MTTLPDFNFLEVDPQVIVNEMLSDYERYTGRKLAEADPVRLFILAQADKIIQLSAVINDSAKQNLLYFARELMLDFKGDEWNTPRLLASKATTTMRFITSAIQGVPKTIPKGTLVTAGDEVFFETTEDAVLAANDLSVEVEAVCQIAGEVGNDYAVGEINVMVQPLVYISECLNIDVSSGGINDEGDDDYRNRIRQAPEKLSTAGPSGAYEYHAKSASLNISDVKAYRSAPGEVTVKVLAKNGEMPGPELIDAVTDKVTPRTVRPLTDHVIVEGPDTVTYNLNLSYYLPSNIVDLAAAQREVENAIEAYKQWQSEKMGRDINPSHLIWLCVKAGAKRVQVNEPLYAEVNEYEVGQLGTENVVFGGVEND